MTCGNRLLLSSSSALAYSFSSTKIVALVSCFVRFKRFHFAKPFFFVPTFLFGIKKETLRSQCGSSHPFSAWQRS
ncbi:hypothetical protein, partial [Staphylococcus argenteus]|uniref:hypothetical protein n=1 Tax=Staphylococcus argenteus TaxID=985002 RepID=UPI001CF00F1D